MSSALAPAKKKKTTRPRDKPPLGLTADQARRLVDRSDETYRVVAIMLRKRCDQAVAAVSSNTREHANFAIPYLVPGMPLFFKQREKVVQLLIDGLTRDGYVVERVDDGMLYVEWGEEARLTRENRRQRRKEEERRAEERAARKAERQRKREEKKKKERPSRSKTRGEEEEPPKSRSRSRSKSRGRKKKEKEDPLEVLRKMTQERRADALLKKLKAGK